MTPAQARCLNALIEQADRNPGGTTTPRTIARALWPDSPAWNRRTNPRHGSSGAMGATMPMNAARLLWALQRQGLATATDNRWTPTPAGRTEATR